MRIKSFKGLLFLIILFATKTIIGQTITGKVTSNDLPLPGVNVTVKGTTKGVVTDFDGIYTISDVKTGEVLVFNSIGFLDKEIVVADNNTTINVDLEEDIESLDEVVVVGYNTTTRRQLTTAVSSVGAEQISEIPSATVNEALEGRAAGVQVASNGSPGEESAVFIRGLNTFGDGKPLYVVDGVFVESLTQINPESIAKVDVLKDAAAAAVYGSRASNGVIIVTTKRGKAGKPKFGFSSYVGIQTLNQSKLPELISGPDLVNVLTEEDVNDTQDGNQNPTRFDDPDYVPANTDYTKGLFRDAQIRNYNIDVSGGSEKATFSMNAGYYDQEGILQKTRFRRYTLNLNSDFKVNDRFKVGQTLNMGYSKSNLPIFGNGLPLQTWGLRTPNYLPVRNEEGLFVNASRDLDGISANVFNPFLFLETQSNEELKFSTNASVFGEVKILDGLTNKTSIAATYFNREFDSKIDSFTSVGNEATIIGDGDNPQKRLIFTRGNTVLTTFTNQLNFNKSFGDHNLNASAIFERNDERIALQRFVNDSQVPNSVDQVNGGVSQTNTAVLPSVLTSYIGLLGYSYGDKYFLNGSIRRDASSKFADPIGIFPSASAAWVVSNESFFDSVGFVSNLKFRYGFGVTGNNRISPFLDTVRLQPVISPLIGGSPDAEAFAFQGLNQTSLTWETSVKQNIGLDLGFLSDKIKLSAEYYTNDSEDLIAFGLNAVSAGNSEIGNVGEVRSKGFEFVGEYNEKIGNVKVGFWGQVSTTDTEVLNINLETDGVLQLPGVPLNAIEGRIENGVSRLRPGNPLWGIYGYKTDGLYKSVDELIDANPDLVNPLFFENGSPEVSLTRTFDASGTPIFTREDGTVVDRANVDVDNAGVGLGDIRFQDVNGDGVVNSDDQTLIGDPNPDFTYSFNLKAEYKGFDLSAFFKGVQGVDVVNGAAISSRSFLGVVAFDRSVLDRYTPTNTATNVPRYIVNDPNANIRFSDRFIEDGSYFRLKSIVLGYSFSDAMLKSFFNGALNKFRIYGQGQNLFTITDYSGLDPEIRPSYQNNNQFGVSGVIGGLGIDRGTPPAPISFVFGVQVGF